MSKDASTIIELIFNYITKIQAAQSHEEILILLADMGRALADADRCTVWVVDQKHSKIWTKVAQGIDKITLDLHSGLVGHSIVNQEQLIINDVYADPRFNQEVDKRTGYKTTNMMVIPMFTNEHTVIGAFQVVNKETGNFDDRDLERLTLAASYAAESLESALLAEENDATQKELIYLMSEAVEKRSKETGNHIKRVAKYSKLLAIAYGLSQKEADDLEFASPMHDIGKIGIPDAILNKPGKLDFEEFEKMKTHAQLGHDILASSSRGTLKIAAIVAYEHHEKYNGKGYPQGLKGEEIHIFGRITALADVFDALGSDRCYKKAWPLEKILEMFKEERGEHFDPVLMDLFFENLDEIIQIRDQFQDK